MTGFRLILFPVIYILTLVSLFIYGSFNDGRSIQSESVTRDSPRDVLFLGIQLSMIQSFLQKGICPHNTIMVRLSFPIQPSVIKQSVNGLA